MATLHLMLSEGFSQDAAGHLARDLETVIKTETPEIVCRKTAERELPPQFIHAVAPAKLWKEALGSSAAHFLNRLGYRGKDIAWDEAEHALTRDDVAPLAHVTKAITDATDSIAQSTSIAVGLDSPDDRFGTVVMIEETRPIKIAYDIARFVSRADDIATVIERAGVTGETPRGPAIVTFEDEGGLMIRWNSRADMRPHEARLPL